MALFCSAIGRDSVSLLKFPFISHHHVFSCEISLVCRLKCLYSCFSSLFVFVIFVLLILVFPVLFLVALISFPLRFSMLLSSRRIDVSTQSLMLAILLRSSLLDTYSLLTSPLGCNTLCIAISFLVFWSIC